MRTIEEIIKIKVIDDIDFVSLNKRKELEGERTKGKNEK